jgi:hypothetical protein
MVWEEYVTNHCHRTRSRSRSHSLKDGVECSPSLRPLRVDKLGDVDLQLNGASTSFTTKPHGLISFLPKRQRGSAERVASF